MDKVFHEPPSGNLCTIIHKEFNEFIKGKGFKGRNNYKLRDLKAMFGFKPMITGSPVTISTMQGPESPLQMEQNQQDSVLCQRLQLLQGYHMLCFYMLRRIPGTEFTLMEKNMK